VSVEHKTIMTAHGKARKKRYGDIIAYSNLMHNHNRKCIAGAIVIVNVSPLYENPDAFAEGLLRPKFKQVTTVSALLTAGFYIRDTPTANFREINRG
jgi:hypothetical protein